MKLHELEKDFREVLLIKRKNWDFCIRFVPKETICLEDCLADDWEVVNKPEDKLQKQLDIYQSCCIDVINNHLKELGCDGKFSLVHMDSVE